MKNTAIRLFLAEDHHVMRAALCSLLSQERDMQIVGEAADGERLLEKVEQLQPDVLVMDAEMPAHDPVQAVTAIQERCPEVTTMVLSAHNKEAYVVELFKAGIAGYVLKDDAADTLVQAIRIVAQGKEWVSPRVATVLVESLRQSNDDPAPQLTDRELEVLSLLALGNTNQAIADQLFVSEHTVRTHVYHIFEKMDVETRVQAAVLAISQGLVPLESVKEKFSERSDNSRHTS